MRFELEVSFQSDIRAFISNVKELNLKKIKISPEPVSAMAARGPGVGWGQSMSGACQLIGKSVKRLPNGLSSSYPFQKTLENSPGAI